MKWALGGWSFFIFENYILSENRSYLIHNFGDDMYHIVYGSASSIAMGSILYGYINKVRNAQPFLWSLGNAAPISAKIISFGCLSLGLGMVGQLPPKVQIPVHFVSGMEEVTSHQGEENNNSDINNYSGMKEDGAQLSSRTTQSTPTARLDEKSGEGEGGGWKVRCPFDFTYNNRKINATHYGGSSDPINIQLHGIERVTRHPGLWSFGLLGVGHGLLVPSLPQKAFLCMPAVVALLGGSHSDSRHRRGLGGALDKEYDEVTSNVPFYAMLSGRQGRNVVEVFEELWVKEVKHSNAMLAVGISALWVLMKGRGGGAKMKLPSR